MSVYDQCMVCNSIGDLVRHHVSYKPEHVVLVCGPCHNRIHKVDGFRPDLTPDRVPPERRRSEHMTHVRMTQEAQWWLSRYMIHHGLNNMTEAVQDLVDENDGEPVPREGVVWRCSGEITKVQAGNAIDDLLEKGNAMTTDGGETLLPTDV